jgi:hypothetical protein
MDQQDQKSASASSEPESIAAPPPPKVARLSPRKGLALKASLASLKNKNVLSMQKVTSSPVSTQRKSKRLQSQSHSSETSSDAPQSVASKVCTARLSPNVVYISSESSAEDEKTPTPRAPGDSAEVECAEKKSAKPSSKGLGLFDLIQGSTTNMTYLDKSPEKPTMPEASVVRNSNSEQEEESRERERVRSFFDCLPQGLKDVWK